MRAVTLSFRDANLERAFRKAVTPRLHWHGRIALLVGVLVYLLFGVLDPFLVPPEVLGWVLRIRIITAVAGFAVWVATWHGTYPRWAAASRVVTGAVAFLSIMAICWLLPPQARSSYHVGLLLVIFFTYQFAGARFIEALVCNVSLVLVFNLLFGVFEHPSLGAWLTQNFALLGANILGGFGAYLAEFQRRRLFVAERLLREDRERWWHDALHDPLTQLPNRALVIDRIEQALSLSRRTGVSGVVMFIDLDGFKAVNDRFGHAAGDRVLQEVARRMRDCLRASDTLGRLGGDEFVLLSMGVAAGEGCRTLSDKLTAVVSEPYHVPLVDGLGMGEVRIGASIGHCFFPEGELDAEDLLNRSDQAMYEVKRARA